MSGIFPRLSDPTLSNQGKRPASSQDSVIYPERVGLTHHLEHLYIWPVLPQKYIHQLYESVSVQSDYSIKARWRKTTYYRFCFALVIVFLEPNSAHPIYRFSSH
ncbi:hypothetical protein TNCV_295081 [Trichonephila clavipes]|nr:hypothetical protein TNCV_295081 [Trichonephila clavipes]